MRFIKALFKEAFGLLVDDVGFAAAIIAWVLAVRLVHPAMVEGAWVGLVFVLGVVLNLIVSVAHRSYAEAPVAK